MLAIKKVLIANRGDIALRVLRTLKDLNIETVAIHTTTEFEALHVTYADESVCIGPPSAKESYLNIHAIISAALITNCDAIHPGYGFLAEDANFAKIVEEHGLIFIGPDFEHIKLMGDKILAKKQAQKIGIKTVPGAEIAGLSDERSLKIAEKIGFPLLIKAAQGGGGRGMKLVLESKDFISSLVTCKAESKAAFGSELVYLEKFLENPRHIEVQVLGDGSGKVLHFYERDCSLQRRHQKIIEEAPSTSLNHQQREEICLTTAQALAKMKYKSAGTVEYLYEDGNFYFIEMNTRIQVEHGITELITFCDLVALQIQIASGMPLDLEQKDISIMGHAIQFRVNAEHPFTFVPSPGTINACHFASGIGVRVDSAIFDGCNISPHFDSLIAKLMAHGSDREKAIQRMLRILNETIIDGVDNNIPLAKKIFTSTDFINNNYSINWLEKFIKKL